MSAGMSNAFEELAVPGVRKLKPYQPGKPIEDLQRELGLSSIIKLASNENPLGPSPIATEASQQVLPELARYPDGNGFVLKNALAEKLRVSTPQITLGNGSNDVLELIVRAFASEGNEVVVSEHTFAIYALAAQAVNAKVVETPARQWGHDLDAMQAAVSKRTKLVFIANPNNPTGTYVDTASLKSFISALPEQVLVIVDEAYFEYASDARLGVKEYPNALEWLAEHKNLIVTRTFSKAYGLAGLRVGYAVSHADIADILNRVRQPFNVNQMALVAANAALKDNDHLDRGIQINSDGMDQLTQGFDRLQLPYIPSAGNFVCVEVGPDAANIYQRLLQEGVIVRPVANYKMPNHLRVSVGLKTENAKFLQALNEIVA
jgi:histidinol-phosphate aminotransferase